MKSKVICDPDLEMDIKRAASFKRAMRDQSVSLKWRDHATQQYYALSARIMDRLAIAVGAEPDADTGQG